MFLHRYILIFIILNFCNCSSVYKQHNMIKNSSNLLTKNLINTITNSLNQLDLNNQMVSNRKKKYKIGQYGAKRREQKRLSKKYEIKVSGKTHEAEHPIGIEPLIRELNLKKDKKYVKNFAPAYQEVKKFHSKHVGTRNKGYAYYEKNMNEDVGFISATYRNALRNLIDDEKIGIAIQINQLGYAFLKDFDSTDILLEIADDSFMKMISNFDYLGFSSLQLEHDFVLIPSYKTNDMDEDIVLISECNIKEKTESIRKIFISSKQKVEMCLARLAARTKRWPKKIINDIVSLNKKFKSELEKDDNSFYKSFKIIFSLLNKSNNNI